MSMHGFIIRNQGSNRFVASVFSILSGFLVVLLLLTSQSAHASSLTGAAAPVIGTSRAVDFAQVSVVRLVATYHSTVSAVGKPIAAFVQCTGLGVMIASWASERGDDQNNWLLTDGSLVNTGQPACQSTASNPNLTLEQVDLYFNTTFNPAMVPAITVSSVSVHCLASVCNGGPALLSFATASNQTFPHIDLASTGVAQDMALALRLPKTSGPIISVPAPFNASAQVSEQQYVKETQHFLTPQQIKPGDARDPLEAGTPIFNQGGELTALELSYKTALAVTDLAGIISNLPTVKLLPGQRLTAIESVTMPTPTTSSAPSAIAPLLTSLVYENW